MSDEQQLVVIPLRLMVVALLMALFADTPFFQGAPWSGSCAAPLFITGFNADGTPQCASRPTVIATTTRHMALSPQQFSPSGTFEMWMVDQGVMRRVDGSANTVLAPIRLPDGAHVGAASCVLQDNFATGKFELQLYTVTPGTPGVTMCGTKAVTVDAPAVVRLVATPGATCGAAVVNNDVSSPDFRVFGLQIYASNTVSEFPPYTNDLAVYQCDVAYDITTVLP